MQKVQITDFITYKNDISLIFGYIVRFAHYLAKTKCSCKVPFC